MLPKDRKAVMSVLEVHSCKYTTACVKQLHEECFIPYYNMNNIRVCAIVSREHPDTLRCVLNSSGCDLVSIRFYWGMSSIRFDSIGVCCRLEWLRSRFDSIGVCS